MSIFVANEKPKNKESRVLFGWLFEVKKGEYLAEIPEEEAKQLQSFNWGSIKADTPKTEVKK